MGLREELTEGLRDPENLKFPQGFNVALAFIDRHLTEGRSDKPAILTPDETVTYAALVAQVNRAADGLTSRGLGNGDRVLMVIRDCPAFFYAFWGAIKAGFIPVPINTLLRADTYAFILNDSKAAAIIYSSEFAAEVEPALKASPWKPPHVLTEAGFATLRAGAKDAFAAVAAGADADCFWLYSSGSTGRPKGAVHRHRDMVVTSQYFAVETLGLGEDDVCYSEAKLFFAYGLGNNMTFPLWVGGTAVLNAGRPCAETSFPILARFQPTVYFGVPTLYATYLAQMPASKPDFAKTRFCVSAGEALPPTILQRWRDETGLWIIDGIGSTEILHIFLSNRIDDIQPGSSGKPVKGYRAKILDDLGVEIAGVGSGRLYMTGASIARCYWNNPQKTAATFAGEWIDTGDTYQRDENGYYYYCGRTDDMMKVGGIWCSAFDIESKLVEHPSVLEAAVIGRNDAAGLVKPEAFVVLKEGVEEDGVSEELLTLCKTRLAPYQYPRWIHFVADLPKTATGKIQRFRLREG
ncbi:MAG: benzoate-CoA ligase family protein [Alphaproteobacteria bacterium]|nr:benzoate-CoA ligase family protein [Alphaproteobacteria bacterium]